jgi:multidrug efflux pump subunit AcrA (membrane-fusion protein)
MFIGYVFIQYSVSFWLTAFWSSGAIPMIFAGLYLLLSTVAISIMAGQSFLADTTAAREKELRAASDTYQAALAQREQAASTAASLAMDEATAAQAQAKLEKLRRDLDAFMSSAATNSTGATVGTVSSVITEGGFKV